MNLRALRIPLLSTGTLCIFALAGALTGLVSTSAQADDDACTARTFKTKEVEAACKKDGRAGAKAVMKAAVKKAKAAGEKMTCKTCHDDIKAFTLTPDAVDKLKRLL